MQVEQGRADQVAVQTGHLRDSARGEPVGLLPGEGKAVRHSGEHPASRHQRGIGTHLHH